jgi:homoserine dehydrogenase
MKTYNLCLLGYGNVNRTLVELLQSKSAEMRERYAIDWRVTGIASRRRGWLANPDGLCGAGAPAREPFAPSQTLPDLHAWLQIARPDVVFEATSLNVESGQPAIEHIRAALEFGAHAITANKGPIVHAYRELRDLAETKHRRFLFESTVMDGIPIFSLFRETLPAIEVRGFRGILNSTTNVILSEMEKGRDFDESLQEAQQRGVAETEASHDIDGWDAAVKVAALVNVVLDVPFKPKDVERRGIRELSAYAVREARAEGRRYKLVCSAHRTSNGVEASVRPEQLPLSDPMALVDGTSSIVRFETDIFPGITLTEENPGLYATAYGMLADFIRAVESRAVES